MRRYAVAAVFVFFFAAPLAHADFYRWVDRDGKEFFTNELEKVPQEYRNSVTTVKPDESRVRVEEKPVAPRKSTAISSERKDKYGRGEEYWRKRAQNLRLKLRDQQNEYDLVLKQLADQDQKPTGLGGNEKQTRSSLEKKKIKLEKDIAKTRRVLEVDLVEEARRADAYPGWLRE